MQPLTLLLNLKRGSFRDRLNEVVLLLQDSGVDARVKAGALLEERGAVQQVNASPFKEGVGRKVTGTSARYDHAATREQVELILENSEVTCAADGFGLQDLLLNNAECISISNVPDAEARRISATAKDSGALYASLRWSATDGLAMKKLWRHLILVRIVTEGQVLADYEETPLDEIFDENLMRWRPDRDPWFPATGFFFHYYDEVFPAESHEHLTIPEDLEDSRSPSPVRSPMERALDAVGEENVTRISKLDDPTSPASFALPDPHLHYPDLVQIEKKVREYCLMPGHPGRKWEGFSRAGWDISNSNHSIQLAALLASALLLRFTPIESRVNADASLQFGVRIAVPNLKTQGYILVDSAWIAKSGEPLRLVTAFTAPNARDAFDATLPFDPHRRQSWAEIVREAVVFGELVPDDRVLARAGVLIPRRGNGNEVCKDLVRSREAGVNLKRSALGGRCLQANFGGWSGWERAGRSTAMAQVLLGLRGILTLPNCWVD